MMLELPRLLAQSCLPQHDKASGGLPETDFTVSKEGPEVICI